MDPEQEHTVYPNAPQSSALLTNCDEALTAARKAIESARAELEKDEGLRASAAKGQLHKIQLTHLDLLSDIERKIAEIRESAVKNLENQPQAELRAAYLAPWRQRITDYRERIRDAEKKHARERIVLIGQIEEESRIEKREQAAAAREERAERREIEAERRAKRLEAAAKKSSQTAVWSMLFAGVAALAAILTLLLKGS